MSDNFHFDLIGVALNECLHIAFQGSPSRKAVAWAVCPIRSDLLDSGDKRDRLILSWHETSTSTPLPAPMTAEAIEPFVRSWLDSTTYGPEPDHDGDNGKGWRVYNEAWAQIGHDGYAFVAIEPVWLMYGK